MTLSGSAKLAGVIGSPISHSKSPRLHGHWLSTNKIDGAYLPLPIAPDDLAPALHGLRFSGFAGLNVTVPHKETVMALCTELTEAAQMIGAVNTVTFGEGGSIHGDNSDAFGFSANLLDQIDQSWFKGRSALVLGAGGAARAVIFALQGLGVSKVFIANRTFEKAQALADRFACTAIAWKDRNDALARRDILINTTVLGMKGQPELDISLEQMPKGGLVNDIVYTPLETPLLAQAKARDLVAVDGLGMLLHQGRMGFERWFGLSPIVDDTLRQTMLAA